MKRFLCLGTVLFLAIICSSCGDVFRPIIIPNPPQFPNPAASHSVLIVSDNGIVNTGVETPQLGTAMVIDVSGDTDEGQKTIGLVPIHAVQQSATQAIVVNQSAAGADQDSLTKLTFSGTSISTASAITLPTGSAPNFVATTEASQAYVSMPGYTPPSVAVVNTALGAIKETIPVGLNPVAIAETPDAKKLYVADYGDSTLDGFNTQDQSPRTITGSFNSPLWVVARNDSQRVYVLNGNGVLSTIDTSGPVSDTVIDTSISVPGAFTLWYDVILNRLYIPAAQQVTIVDVSQSTPSTLATIPIAALPPSTSRSAPDPCAGTTPGPLKVVAATSLPDASRAYIGAYYIDSADNVCPQVTVINATNLTVKTGIAIPGFPDATNPANSLYYVPVCASTRDLIGPTGGGFRIMMAAGGDSTRAYLSSCDGGNVNIIQTATDNYALNIPAPFSARPPIVSGNQNPPQNPVFMIAGP
jgi:DNA-binding beta-propeller fold protein YncE